MYIMGENPAMSDPDVDHAREAMAALDHLRRAGHLPHRNGVPRRRGAGRHRVAREGRHRHQHRPHGAARTQGDRAARRRAAKTSGSLNELGQPHGRSTGTTRTRAKCSTRCALCMDSIAGITWDRLERESSVTYPCVKEGDPGRSGGVHRQLPDRDRAARKFVPADLDLRGRAAGRRVPDGAHHRPPARTLAHRLDDAPRVGPRLHRAGAGGVGASARSRSARRGSPAATLTIESRRGSISLYARADDGMPRGAVFVPFCYYEAAANMLTNPVLDPFGKIPEFKYCAVKITAGGTPPERTELRRRRPAARPRTRGQVGQVRGLSWGPPSGGPTIVRGCGSSDPPYP